MEAGRLSRYPGLCLASARQIISRLWKPAHCTAPGIFLVFLAAWTGVPPAYLGRGGSHRRGGRCNTGGVWQSAAAQARPTADEVR
jgi:hypothetical protein